MAGALERAVAGLIQPEGGPRIDFRAPLGEPALVAPDSVSWRVFKNPVALFIGGAAAVLLELAEPIASGWIKVRHRDGDSGFVKAAEVWGE